ncbi:MAG TPA: TetR/AcrR family transcriptional regulator [Microbacteriaceae bacterium]|nr:TetR/AcrR family transcriptional regulator [Microbacteriaceae bacterium]
MDRQKSTRIYDSRSRQVQARNNREAILDAARERFLADGYAATTIASIAAAAGMSVDTVHKAFGGKPGLVRAIYDRSLAGEGPVAAPERSDDMQSAERDPHALVQGWGVLTSEVAPLVAPIHLLVRDAAIADPEMATLLRQSDAQRRQRMLHNAQTLAGRDFLREEITLGHATDVLWTYSSPELYELLVVRCEWDLIRYGQFIGDSIAAALLN